MSPDKEKELFKAYRLLFKPGGPVMRRHIREVDSPSLKKAYRREVLQSHPDRARSLGVNPVILTQRFFAVEKAFRVLNEYISTPIVPRSPENNSQTKPQTAGVGSGVPSTELMLGQYLFYRGIVPMNILLEALAWQREQRKSFGEIAVEMYYLSRSDIPHIIQKRNYREKFGECALRLGYINSFQHTTIMKKQALGQKPLGDFFIQKNLMTRATLERYVQEQQEHNRRIRSSYRKTG